MEIGIVVLCTNAYFVLGIRFVKRFMHFYKGDKKIKFYLFTDENPEGYLPNGINYQYINTRNDNWTDGTNLKFSSILQLENCTSNYLYYFDADTNVSRDFTEEWFLGDSVGGQHYADQSWMKEVKGFERNPRSKAYIPLDTTLPQCYFYGAFWGGTKEWVLKFCKIMLEWQKADKSWGYEPCVNDESFSNAYFHYNAPTKVVLCQHFMFDISDKGGLGETRNMNLDISEKKKQLKALKDVFINIANNEIKY